MKRSKFKKMKLQLETLESTRMDECVVCLQGLTVEMPEVSILSMESVEQKEKKLENGSLLMEMDARGIRTDDKRITCLKAGKQAEILDYNYFRSRLSQIVITDIQAEVFNFRKSRTVPFAVKKLEFSFGNGKKIDMTNKVSILSLDRLAS